MPQDNQYLALKSEILGLVNDWEKQVKEFRKLSLDTNDPVQRARMRAKADTLHYRRAELKNALEWVEDDSETSETSS